jgi:alanine-glyoxylate transaminase/(R)-3-amino-2-methylpropionate-pyruvate transaminase
MGATVATEEVAQAWNDTVTIATFGGNPVSSTAACATIDAIMDRKIPQHVEAVGARLRAGLEELRHKYPANIGDVRGMGLMQAVELVADETSGDRAPDAALTAALFEATKKRGLLIGKGGRWGNVIRIAPPMTVSAAQIDQALGLLGESFAEIGAR